MSIDVGVAEGGTATSQRRNHPLDDQSTSNAADHPPTPQSWNPSDEDRSREELDRLHTPQSWNPSDEVRLWEELDCSPTPRARIRQTRSDRGKS
jgi:hypothetical protein